jgi:hypothetical protein
MYLKGYSLVKLTEINKLDKLWREAIHSRDKFCQVCHQTESRLNAHHVIGRRNQNLRWELQNGILLCAGCHTFKTTSAHQDPLWFSEWFQQEYPERYEYITSNRVNLGLKYGFDYWKDLLKP